MMRTPQRCAPIRSNEETRTLGYPELGEPERTLLKSSSCPSLVGPHAKPSAYFRVAVRSGGDAASALTPCTTPAASRLCIRTPASGAATTSGVPQIADATTGVPHAIDSRSTFAQPSRLEASTSMSTAL